MNKQEIIILAKSMGFKLDYDRYDDKEYPGVSSELRFLRFVSIDDSLDEKELRWIWFKDSDDKENIIRGKVIKSRLDKKKTIQEFLKY